MLVPLIMPKQLAAIAIFVLFACTTTFGNQNPKHRMLTQIDKIRTSLEDAVKLMDNEETSSGQNLPQLQATANKLYLYAQEAFYVFSKAVDQLADPYFRTHVALVIKSCQEYGYNLGKNINSDAAHLRQAMKATLENFLNLVSPARKLFEQPENEKHQLALSSVAEAYNLGSFNSYMMYVEIKYRNKSNKEIVLEIEAVLEKALTFLKNIDSKGAQLSRELARILGYSNYFSERIVENIERWAYIYKVTTPQSQELTVLAQNLGKVVGELRISTRSSATIPELQNSLAKFLRNSSTEMKNLIQTNTGESKQEDGIYKEVLLEYLTLLSIITMKIEIVATPSPN